MKNLDRRFGDNPLLPTTGDMTVTEIQHLPKEIPQRRSVRNPKTIKSFYQEQEEVMRFSKPE